MRTSLLCTKCDAKGKDQYSVVSNMVRYLIRAASRRMNRTFVHLTLMNLALVNLAFVKLTFVNLSFVFVRERPTKENQAQSHLHSHNRN